MDGHAELQGWELLPRVDPLRPSSASDEDGGDPFGVITADYFVLDSGGKSPIFDLQVEGEKAPSESGDDLDLAEKAPTFDPSAVEEPLEPTEQTAADGGNAAVEEMDLGGEVCSEGDSDASWLDSWGDEIGCLREFKRAEGDVLPSIGESDRGGDGFGRGSGGFGGVGDGGGEKKGDAWWKVPLELVKLCLSRVRPVWSLSVAAAVVGLALLSRRLYRARRLSRRIHLAAVLDDKKVRQIPATARLNEAFTMLRQAPSIKAPLPATGVTPWPTMALRL